MARLQDEVRRIVAAEGVVARRDHPELDGAIAWLRRTGELVSVLPGVLCPPGAVTDLGTRVQAVRARDPDAVFTRDVAARLGYWPERRVGVVTCAVPGERESRPGIVYERRTIPPELVMTRDGIRMTTPALTTLDLCSEGSDPIDDVLRMRAARLVDLREALALTARRRGNARRLELLLDSRDEPWSSAERLCHRMLREHRIDAWKANHPLTIEGRNYFLDIAFPRAKVVIEIDGRFHGRVEATFENDRVRQNALVLAGWIVLRFTTRRLEDEPACVIADITSALVLSRSRRSQRR